MLKVLLVATVQSHICQFHRPLADLLHAEGCEVHVAARDNLAEKNGLALDFADKIFDVPFSRSPFKFSNIKAYRQLKKIIEIEGYDIIHCNTPVGGFLTRIAARKARKNGTRVFYTAHGFHFYNGAPLINWLIYYPIEKICSFFTDVLITINHEDYGLAKKKMRAKRIEYIPGVGVDVNKFKNTLVNRSEKRKELGVPKEALLLLSVGELNSNKNHQVVIRAVAQLKDPNVHYVIAGNGPLYNDLLKLAKELGVADRVHLLGYRRDVAELCKVSDVFCFPSIREGLGLAVIESMAAGNVVVAADNRGTREMICDDKNGFVCRTCTVNEFAEAVFKLGDPSLRQRLGETGQNIACNFSVEHVVSRLKDIYQI